MKNNKSDEEIIKDFIKKLTPKEIEALKEYIKETEKGGK